MKLLVLSDLHFEFQDDEGRGFIQALGARYWVNGREHRSLTEAEEKARPDYRIECDGEVSGGSGKAAEDEY